MEREELRNRLVNKTDCEIQHDGWPCNTCFHAMKLPLKNHIHDYWLAVLAYRGDYPDDVERPELIAELFDALEVTA